MQLNLLVLSYVAAAVVSAGVVVVAWRRGPMVGIRPFALLMVSVTWWLAANAAEAAAVDRTAKIVASVIAYPGIMTTPILFLVFVLTWTRQGAWLTGRRIALLMVVPAISVVMAATNEWHHLLWTSVTLVDAWGVTAVYQHGPWFYIEVAYSYGVVATGLIALIVALYRYPGAYSARMRATIVAAAVPIIVSVAYALGFDASVHADLSSIAFALTGLIAGWAILRDRLIASVPVAWSTVVDMLSDAVLVLDAAGRIAAFNPPTTHLLGIDPSEMGRDVDDALPSLPELVALCRATAAREAEIRVGPHPAADYDPSVIGSSAIDPDRDERWLSVQVTVLDDGQGGEAGRLVVLRDVTERRRMVETIRELSVTDELTGLLNRRGFTTLAEQQLRTAVRTRNRLWLLFVDLDGLKEINDELGHEVGDDAIREIARLLRTASFREGDIIARLGGDEFAVLATETGPTDGSVLVARIEDALRAANDAPARAYRLSASVGEILFDPADPQALDELLHAADRRMYEAKRSRRVTGGRNGDAVQAGS